MREGLIMTAERVLQQKKHCIFDLAEVKERLAWARKQKSPAALAGLEQCLEYLREIEEE